MCCTTAGIGLSKNANRDTEPLPAPWPGSDPSLGPVVDLCRIGVATRLSTIAREHGRAADIRAAGVSRRPGLVAVDTENVNSTARSLTALEDRRVVAARAGTGRAHPVSEPGHVAVASVFSAPACFQ